MNTAQNTGKPQPIRPARTFDSIWWAKRGGIILLVMITLVFGTEATLATLRRRDVTVQISLYNPTVTVTQTSATADPSATATPMPAVLSVRPSDTVRVSVHWYYHIGPRFPHTLVRAIVLIDNRNVAQGEVNIDCGAASLDCSGDQVIELRYTVPDSGTGNGTQLVDWPAGQYQLNIDKSEGGLNPVLISTYKFAVSG